MALRIAGGKQDPTQDPEDDPTQIPDPTDPDGDGDDDSTSEGDTDQDYAGKQGGALVDPSIAGYEGPDQGPFMCANCVHFQGDGTCEIVSGSIDHMGCCNLFSSLHSVSQDQTQQDTGDDEGDAGNLQQTGTSQPVTEPDEPEGT